MSIATYMLVVLIIGPALLALVEWAGLLPRYDRADPRRDPAARAAPRRR
ncbi:hypothetical protein [Sphingomicrobium astaxanthinifaciens]|nr:hypothetical protein [Sphingomicrobium astaxanthinifaciens]MCJ7421467.1 hypothetical protein [Sphingomicrobium astaxanthinifaciens]